MPTKCEIGKPSEGNDQIGGVPVIHYLDFLSRGRGQAVRLLFIDSGIAFTDVRYSSDEISTVKDESFLPPPNGLNPTGNVPILQLNGKTYTQSYPILRHFSRVLGNKYDGEDEDEVYFTDRICDIVIDWRTRFVDAFVSPNKDETYPEHCKTARVNYLRALERHLSENQTAKGGSYVIGKKFTYADIVLFQILHDEELYRKEGASQELKPYSRLAQLAEAVINRPNIKAFFNSSEYKG
ncbi:putative glutathione s [Phaeomoniella chlamydospora]|uniref:Putative glutathione s n=1 Tax=Phaeomoniella chlamydospora TaxID=158046 RepID=A0A0G2E1Q6_PHACM|nr:putative glutathione s [Phaeomoniella chlamydospora]